MRSDMTIPIARLVATRLRTRSRRTASPTSATPTGRCARSAARCGSSLQAGVELIGSPAPEGTAEVIEVLSAALDAAGLNRAVVGLGDADLYRQLLAELGVAGEHRDRILDRLGDPRPRRPRAGGGRGRGPERRGREHPAAPARLRGGPEVLDQATELGGAAVERATASLRATYDLLASRGVAERVRLDLGLLRDLGYYTGRSSRSTTRRWGTSSAAAAATTPWSAASAEMPAAGFALYVERLHVAQTEEER